MSTIITPAMARRIEIWPIGQLVPYAKNARTHSPEQVAQIAASIVEFRFVNSLLRALGLFGASSATQLQTFVLASLYAGDGSGAAEIADDLVTPIIGSGYEKQWRFQGVLASQKPFRDWMVEILACGLGYFTFEFGKLKVGSRINASAVEAFTLGNILFQTLRLEPVEAAFEHLIIDFADQAYQYQANTAEHTDKDHSAYYGRAGAPLTARQHLVGFRAHFRGNPAAARYGSRFHGGKARGGVPPIYVHSQLRDTFANSTRCREAADYRGRRDGLGLPAVQFLVES